MKLDTAFGVVCKNLSTSQVGGGILQQAISD